MNIPYLGIDIPDAKLDEWEQIAETSNDSWAASDAVEAYLQPYTNTGVNALFLDRDEILIVFGRLGNPELSRQEQWEEYFG